MRISCNLPTNLLVPCLFGCHLLPLVFHALKECSHSVIYISHIAGIVSDNTFQLLTCLQFRLCTNAGTFQQCKRHYGTAFGQPIAWQRLPTSSRLMTLSASRLLYCCSCNTIAWPSIWLILHFCFPLTLVTCLFCDLLSNAAPFSIEDK